MKNLRILELAASVLLLSACGGSGSSSHPNPGEPNETIGTATPVVPGTPMAAVISSLTDLDVYSFTVPAGGATVHVQTFDQGGVSCDLLHDTVDTFVIVYDAAGVVVTTSDDTGINWCEDFTVALAAGTNYVEVSGYPPVPFAYTLKVSFP